MSTRPEVIAAAEALRLWVQRQRASWPTPLPTSFDRAMLAASAPSAASMPMPSPAFAPVALPPLKIPIPDLDFAGTVPSRRLAGAAALVRRAAALVGTAAAAIAIVATAGLGGRWAWNSFVTHAKGTASISSSPAGAEVLVDGVSMGTTPLHVQLPTGQHALELRRRGTTRAQALQIARNGESKVNIDWSVRQKGRLKVESDPVGAHVIVDGRDVGVAPLTLPDIAVGGHTVVLESSAGSVRRRVDVSEGTTEELTESIFPGWVRVSAPVEVTVSEAGKPVPLDNRNRALLKPGIHQLRIDNAALGFSQVRKVEVEPGATAEVAIEASVSTLNVTSNVPAEILVDGTKVGDAPIINLTMKLGTRSVVAVDRSGNQQRQTVTITSRPASVEFNFLK